VGIYIVKKIKMVTVTQKAAEKIKDLIQEEGGNKSYLRVAVKGGGCSGLSYDMSLDYQIEDKDTMFEDKGIKILVDNKSLLYLYGTELEFSDGLNGKGFQFVNPNASRTCGCGESFAV
jgi:iron-sulfur cluster assembly protein